MADKTGKTNPHANNAVEPTRSALVPNYGKKVDPQCATADPTLGPAEILQESADLYALKNEMYGDAWTLGPDTVAFWMEELGIDELGVTSDPKKLRSFSLYIRRLEKLIRSFNGEFGLDEEMAYEGIADGHVDSAPYSAMHASIYDLKPEFFDDGTDDD